MKLAIQTLLFGRRKPGRKSSIEKSSPLFKLIQDNPKRGLFGGFTGYGTCQIRAQGGEHAETVRVMQLYQQQVSVLETRVRHLQDSKFLQTFELVNRNGQATVI